MGTRHRDFDAARAEHVGEPLTFTLNGTLFTCVADVPSGPLLDMAANADLADAAAFSAFGEFLRSIVVPDQADDFNAALRTVGLATLLELVSWVVGEITGRPLSVPSSSPASASSDGGSSRVVSLSPVGETRSA